MDSRETGIEAYQKVERDIAREEQAAPAPSLGHEMAKLDRFIADIENLMSQLNQERIADVELTSNDRFSQKYFNSRYCQWHIFNERFIKIVLYTKYTVILVFIFYRIVDESDNAIRTVMIELRINMNQTLAIEHEEFIANLNRKVRYSYDNNYTSL